MLEDVDARAGRPGNEHGADLGADEVIGATGSEKSEIFGLLGVDKLEHVGRVGEAGDDAAMCADVAAQDGGNLDGDLFAAGAGGVASPPKRTVPLARAWSQ